MTESEICTASSFLTFLRTLCWNKIYGDYSGSYMMLALLCPYCRCKCFSDASCLNTTQPGHSVTLTGTIQGESERSTTDFEKSF